MYTGGNGAEWRQRGGTDGMPMETTAKHRANWIGLGWVTMTALPVTILGLPLPLVVVVTRLIETDRSTAPTTDLLSSPCLGIGSADLGIDSLLRRTSLDGCLSVVSPFYFSSRGTLPSEWVALAGIRTFAMGVQWIAVVLVAINREPSPPCLATHSAHVSGLSNV